MHVLAMEVGCKFSCYVLWFSVLVTMTGGVRGVVYDYSEIGQKQGNISTGKRRLGPNWSETAKSHYGFKLDTGLLKPSICQESDTNVQLSP